MRIPWSRPYSERWVAAGMPLLNSKSERGVYLQVVGRVLPIVDLLVKEEAIEHINDLSYPIEADTRIMFVAKYIKAYYSRQIDQDQNGKDRLDACQDSREATALFDQLLKDDSLVSGMSTDFKRISAANRSQFTIFVKMLYRRFQVFQSITFLYNQELARLGSILFQQYVVESFILCTEGYEYSLQNWSDSNVNFLIRDPRSDISHRILYPPGGGDKLKQTDLARIVSGGEAEMLELDSSKERSIQKLLWALGLEDAHVHEVIMERQFVLTDEIVLKLIMIHERKLARCPMIIEGETGVGKTFPIQVYADLINKAANVNKSREDCPLLVPQLCRWLCDEVLAADDAASWFEALEYFHQSSESDGSIVERLQSGNFEADSFIAVWTDTLSRISQHQNPVDALEEGELLLRAGSVGPVQQPERHPAVRLLTWIKNVENTVPLIQVSANLQMLLTHDVSSAYDEENAEVSKRALEELLKHSQRRSLFKRIMLHPGITSRDLETFMGGVLDLAERIKRCAGGGKPTVEQVVFFDEMNTAGCLGALKEMLVDRTINGREIPDSVFIVAAINPRTGHTQSNDAADVAQDDANVPEIHRHFYLVNELPDVLSSMRVKFAVMETGALRTYVRDRVDLFEFECKTGAQHDRHIKEGVATVLVSAHTFFQECPQFGLSAVSQREFTRVFKLMPFFVQLLTAKSGQYPHHNTILKQSVFLSLALVYYFRLPIVSDSSADLVCAECLATEHPKTCTHGNTENLRDAFCNHVFTGGEGKRFKEVIKDHLLWFVSRDHFIIPNAVALNDALLENVFAIVACTQTDVPLGIIGSPGSSKTLAYNIVRDNLLGPLNSPLPFCKQFAKLDTFFCQCSRYSTAQDIESVFKSAIARQNKHNEQVIDKQRAGDTMSKKTRCVVFLDEAGLPRESRNVLKVLHSYLDEQAVAFVCISNVMFDAANANRMVKVYRSKSTLDDLVILARGCAGISTEKRDDTRTMQIVKGICDGYLQILLQPRFSKMFHYRDLIYLFRQLNRNSPSQHLVINETDLLLALEENFNGVCRKDFRDLCTLFFKAVAVSTNIDFKMPATTRDMLTILRDSIQSPVPVGHDMSPRFKLLIDPTDGDASSLLFDSGILDPSRTKIFRMSDFTADQSDVHAAETISEITLSMESASCNVLVNTSRIDDSLYDLYNKRFRPSVKSVNGEIQTDMYANIAIGNRTHPKLVHANTEFIVILKQGDLDVTPAPFLSRFSKYLINMSEFLSERVNALPTAEQQLVGAAFDQVKGFVKHMRPSSFYGLISTQVQRVQQKRGDGIDEENQENAVAALFMSHLAVARDPSALALAQLPGNQSTFIGRTSLVSQAMSALPQPPGDVTLDVRALRLKSTVQALCTRLLQICPPELLTLKLPTIGLSPQFYAQMYFKMSEHFDLERLIHSVAVKLQHSDNGNEDTQLEPFKKNFIFVRDSVALHRSVNRIAENAGLYAVLDVARYECKTDIEADLATFDSSRKKRLLFTVATRRRADISTVVHLVDRLKLETKFVFILVVFPGESFFEPKYPALFTNGWDSHFLDASGGTGHLLVQKLALFMISDNKDGEAPHDVNGTALDAQTQHDETMNNFCAAVKVSPGLRMTRVTQDVDDSVRRFYHASVPCAQRMQCLRDVIHRHPILMATMTMHFSTLFGKNRLFQVLHGLASKLCSKPCGSGFADLVHRHCNALLDRFFGTYLEQLCQGFGLHALAVCNPAASKEVLEALLDTVAVPSLGDIASSVEFTYQVPMGTANFIPATPLYHRLNSIVEEHTIEIGVDLPDPVATLHERLCADESLARILAIPVGAPFWNVYARDLTVSWLISGRVKPEDDEAIDFITEVLRLGITSSSKDTLARLHLAKRDVGGLRLLFAGFKAVGSRAKPKDDARPLQFKKLFIENIFLTLWQDLSKAHGCQEIPLKHTKINAWMESFALISGLFQPSAWLRGSKAKQIDCYKDLMHMCYTGLSLLDWQRNADAADVVLTLLLPLGVGRTPSICLEKIITTLCDMRDKLDADAFLHATLMWYTFNEDKKVSALQDITERTSLFNLLNDAHPVKLNHNAKLKLFEHVTEVVSMKAGGAQGSAAQIIAQEVDAIICSNTVRLNEWSSLDARSAERQYLPRGHPSRHAKQHAIFREAPLCDVFFEWLVQVGTANTGKTLSEHHLFLVDAAKGIQNRPRDVLENGAHTRIFLQSLANHVQSEATGGDVERIKDYILWCSEDKTRPLCDSVLELYFLTHLTKGLPSMQHAGELLSSVKGVPWIERVVKILQVAPKRISGTRLSFMNTNRSRSEHEAFPALHPLYSSFSDSFDKMMIGCSEEACAQYAADVGNLVGTCGVHGMPADSVIKMFHVLKVYHDYWDWGGGPNESLEKAAAANVHGCILGMGNLGWSANEQAIVVGLFNPSEGMQQWGEGTNRVAELFRAPDAVDDMYLRGICVNMAALVIGKGEDRSCLFSTFLYKPEGIIGSHVPGSTGHTEHVGRGVHLDCMNIFNFDGQPAYPSPNALPPQAIRWFATAHYAAISMNTVFFPGAHNRLYGQNSVLSTWLVDERGHEGGGGAGADFTYGQEPASRIANLCLHRARTGFMFLAGENTDREMSYEHTALFFNRVMERFALFALEGDGSFLPLFATPQQIKTAEDNFMTDVFITEQQQFEATKQLLATLQNAALPLELLKYDASQPTRASVDSLLLHMQTPAIRNDQTFNVLRRFLELSGDFQTLADTIVHVSNLYKLIHDKLAYMFTARHAERPLQDVMCEYTANLNTEAKRQRADRIFTKGVDAFNEYHRRHDGMLPGGVCDIRNRFFPIKASTTYLGYVVTTAETLALGEMDALADMLRVVVASETKIQNGFLQYCETDAHLAESSQLLLGSMMGRQVDFLSGKRTGLMKVSPTELTTLIHLFSSETTTADGTHVGWRFDLLRLQQVLYQRYVAHAMEIKLEARVFRYKVTRSNGQGLIAIDAGPSTEQLSKLPQPFCCPMDDEKQRLVRTILEEQGSDDRLVRGTHHHEAVQVVRYLSSVSQLVSAAHQQHMGERHRQQHDCDMPLHEYFDQPGIHPVQHNGEMGIPEGIRLIAARIPDIKLKHLESLYKLCRDRLAQRDYMFAHMPRAMREDLPVDVHELVVAKLNSIEPLDGAVLGYEHLAQQLSNALVILDSMHDDISVAPDNTLLHIFTTFLRRHKRYVRLASSCANVLECIGLGGADGGDGEANELQHIKGIHISEVTKTVMEFSACIRLQVLDFDINKARQGKSAWTEIPVNAPEIEALQVQAQALNADLHRVPSTDTNMDTAALGRGGDDDTAAAALLDDNNDDLLFLDGLDDDDDEDASHADHGDAHAAINQLVCEAGDDGGESGAVDTGTFAGTSTGTGTAAPQIETLKRKRSSTREVHGQQSNSSAPAVLQDSSAAGTKLPVRPKSPHSMEKSTDTSPSAASKRKVEPASPATDTTQRVTAASAPRRPRTTRTRSGAASHDTPPANAPTSFKRKARAEGPANSKKAREVPEVPEAAQKTSQSLSKVETEGTDKEDGAADTESSCAIS